MCIRDSPEVFGKYGADASRQWAATGGSTGTDIPFRWVDVEYGWRFMRKLWNACVFASAQLGGFDPETEAEPELLDRWILSRLERVVKIATEEFEGCRYMNATEAVRNFVWHVFCDHYLEAAKHRLYSEGEEKASTQGTLLYVTRRILQLLAPVMPHITEEIYSAMYAEGESESIHLSRWPEADESLISGEAEKRGDLIVAVIRDVRREKNRLGIPLNTPLKGLSIYAMDAEDAEILTWGIEDISATVKADDVEVFEGRGGAYEVEGYPGVCFSIPTGTDGT